MSNNLSHHCDIWLSPGRHLAREDLVITDLVIKYDVTPTHHSQAGVLLRRRYCYSEQERDVQKAYVECMFPHCLSSFSVALKRFSRDFGAGSRNGEENNGP